MAILLLWKLGRGGVVGECLLSLGRGIVHLFLAALRLWLRMEMMAPAIVLRIVVRIGVVGVRGTGDLLGLVAISAPAAGVWGLGFGG